jgi:hypothetical protein
VSDDVLQVYVLNFNDRIGHIITTVLDQDLLKIARPRRRTIVEEENM